MILYMCVSAWHHTGAPAELTWCSVACVCMHERAWHYDIARAPMLSPIML